MKLGQAFTTLFTNLLSEESLDLEKDFDRYSEDVEPYTYTVRKELGDRLVLTFTVNGYVGVNTGEKYLTPQAREEMYEAIQVFTDEHNIRVLSMKTPNLSTTDGDSITDHPLGYRGYFDTNAVQIFSSIPSGTGNA